MKTLMALPVLAMSLLAVMALTTPAQAQSLRVESDDGSHSLTLHGRFQLRYAYVVPYGDAGEDPSSSIYLRRLQPDIRGTAFDDLLEFRVMLDIARGSELLDGWVALRLNDTFRLRMGQFTVPFNRERHPAPTQHLFVERSAANNHFQVPTGRDIGLMTHGVLADRLNLAVGFFSGQGRNQAINPSTGHLISGRAVAAVIGDLQMDEVPGLISDVPHLNLGAGAYYTFQNSAREWNLFGIDPDAEADVLAATADVYLRWNRFALHAAGFGNQVTPSRRSPGFDQYQGVGFTGQLGVLAIEERLVFVGRYSQALLDTERDDQIDEIVLGSTFLHRGNDSKLHLEFARSARVGAVERVEDQLRLQYQFLF